MKRVLMLLTSISLFSCGVSEQEHNKLKKELEECKKVVADLQNTPQNRLVEIQNLLKDNKLDLAKQKLEDFSEKFPKTDEFFDAETAVLELEQRVKYEQKEAERKKALGFKVLKEKSIIDIATLSLAFDKITTQKEWVFDDYGDGAYSRSAERGNIYLTTKVNVKSKDKNPSLPPILAYYLHNGELKYIGNLNYRFSRWKSYGHYLGNYADYGNDFAHSEKITFSCGLQIDKNYLNYPIYLVVLHSECVHRTRNDYGNPEIAYKYGECEIKETLKVEDFDLVYSLVKIISKK